MDGWLASMAKLISMPKQLVARRSYGSSSQNYSTLSPKSLNSTKNLVGLRKYKAEKTLTLTPKLAGLQKPSKQTTLTFNK